MAKPQEKLAEALSVLQELQKGGRRVFRSSEISRTYRERLVSTGFLKEVMRGWLILSSPEEREGDSTSWYASFWDFCALYCNDRFGKQWHLSPEQSLLLHGENTVIPKQVVVYSPQGTNNSVSFLFDTSLYDLKQEGFSEGDDIESYQGLNTYSVGAALVRVSGSFFQAYPIEVQTVLSRVLDVSDILRHLLEGGHSNVAGRLAGAFRRTGNPKFSEEILSTMKAAGYVVRESDPFDAHQQIFTVTSLAPPIVSRLKALWLSNREDVLSIFPSSSGYPSNPTHYLQNIDETYEVDAYHSLSIEGYKVTPDLISRVKSGLWNPDQSHADSNNKDALAARGYWQSFQLVKEDVSKVISGANPGELTRETHKNWYRQLFQPCVAAGLIEAKMLAGYRTNPVYLRTSRYVPPRFEVLRDAMPAFFDLITEEESPGVKAVLGHWLFGYIHPFPDGNGRIYPSPIKESGFLGKI